MALVKSYTNGNTKIRIFDDCVKPNEVQEILKRCAEIVARSELKHLESTANSQRAK